MRIAKLAMITVTMAASLIVGLGGTASAAPASHMKPSTVWCC